MTCKDCIHYDICVAKNTSVNVKYCYYFKNKADFVEVVRCGKCTHGHWEQETCHGKCVHYCDLTDLQINKEHFCSYGERKE